MQNIDEMRAHHAGKAEEDEAFRAQLPADPRSTTESEPGIAITRNVGGGQGSRGRPQGQSLSAYSVSRIMTIPKVVDTSP